MCVLAWGLLCCTWKTLHVLVQFQPCAAKVVLGAGSVRCRALQVCVFALLLAARKFVKPEMTE